MMEGGPARERGVGSEGSWGLGGQQDNSPDVGSLTDTGNA